MTVNVKGWPIPEKEILAYQQRGLDKYGDKLEGMDIEIDDEDRENVKITYHLEGKPFERIRRITGYLVGTMDRWNDAKRAEERDRVKHG